MAHRPVHDIPPQLAVEFVPTPSVVVEAMLQAANPAARDVVFDLGCGDGRLVIEAALQYGARGIGFDLDPVRVEQAQAAVQAANVSDLVTIEHADLFALDLRPASVVTLYLGPDINLRLVPQLQRLTLGARIISHDFDIKGYDYDEVWTLQAPNNRARPRMRDHHVFKWTAPLVHD